MYFGLPWAGVCLILQVAVSEKQQMDALLAGVATALSMKQALHIYFAFCQKQPSGPSAENLESSLVTLYATVLGFLVDATYHLEKSGFSRFWSALLDDGELQKFGSGCSEAEQRVELAAGYCDGILDEQDRVLLHDCRGLLDRIMGDLGVIKAQTARIELNTNFAKLPERQLQHLIRRTRSVSRGA